MAAARGARWAEWSGSRRPRTGQGQQNNGRNTPAEAANRPWDKAMSAVAAARTAHGVAQSGGEPQEKKWGHGSSVWQEKRGRSPTCTPFLKKLHRPVKKCTTTETS